MVAFLTWIYAPDRGRVRSMLVRYLGPIPDGPVSKADADTWLRNACLKLTLPTIPVLILLVLWIDKTWAFVALGVWAVVWCSSMAGWSWWIRRLRESQPT